MKDLLKSATGLRPYFEYTVKPPLYRTQDKFDKKVKGVAFDLLFPIETHEDRSDRNNLRDFEINVDKIHNEQPTFDGLGLFGTEGLPQRNQKTISEVDFEKTPGVINTAMWSDEIKFQKIWEDVEKNNPEGARAYLAELVDEEQGFIEAQMRHAAEQEKIKNQIQIQETHSSKPASSALFLMELARKAKESYQEKLSALMEFSKKNNL